MELTIQDIKHLANLSALEFSAQEIDRFKDEFNTILKVVEQINSVEVDEEYEYNITKYEDLREDELRQGLSQDEVLQNAPSKNVGCFVVPLMMD